MALNWKSAERLVVWFVDFLYHDVYSNKKSLQMAPTNVYCLGSARKLLSVKQKNRA